MNTTPLVSVIVITYNSAKFVLETLESAKAQTYEVIELIVSDDASTDNTVEICREWIEKNKERFIRTELITVPKNTGIPANCNRGVRVAQGEWVKLIAGDDALNYESIEKYLKHLNSNPFINALFAAMETYKYTFDTSNLIVKKHSSHINAFFDQNISARDQYVYLLLKEGFGGLAPTALLRKSAVISSGGFDERFRNIEDLPMWLRLTGNGVKLHYVNFNAVKYRIHQNNIYNQANGQLIKSSYFTYDALRKEYLYPHYTCFYYLKFRYDYYVKYMLFKTGLNRNNLPGRAVLKIMTEYLNIFNLVDSLHKIIFKKEIRKLTLF